MICKCTSEWLLEELGSEGLRISSLDATKKWIESDVDEVGPLMKDEEEPESPLKGKEEHANSIIVDSK